MFENFWQCKGISSNVSATTSKTQKQQVPGEITETGNLAHFQCNQYDSY